MQIDSIQNNTQSLLAKTQSKNSAINVTEIKKFEEMMETKEKGKTEKDTKLTEMIDNVDKLKRVLDYDLTVNNLNDYKEAVKSFVNYYTKNELKMEDHVLTDRQGYQKKVSIIRSIDDRLNDLDNNFLESPLGHLETLRKIGEIQGLVVNLLL